MPSFSLRPYQPGFSPAGNDNDDDDDDNDDDVDVEDCVKSDDENVTKFANSFGDIGRDSAASVDVDDTKGFAKSDGAVISFEAVISFDAVISFGAVNNDCKDDEVSRCVVRREEVMMMLAVFASLDGAALNDGTFKVVSVRPRGQRH